MAPLEAPQCSANLPLLTTFLDHHQPLDPKWDPTTIARSLRKIASRFSRPSPTTSLMITQSPLVTICRRIGSLPLRICVRNLVSSTAEQSKRSITFCDSIGRLSFNAIRTCSSTSPLVFSTNTSVKIALTTSSLSRIAECASRITSFMWFMNRRDIVKHGQNYTEIQRKKQSMFPGRCDGLMDQMNQVKEISIDDSKRRLNYK